MIENCHQIKELVLSSFQENIQISVIENGCEITLPLLDPLNDYIQFYIIPTKDGYQLTDYGEVIEKLRSLNLEITTLKRENIFESILQTNGVSYFKGMLQMNIDKDFSDFQKKLFLYIKAIVTTYDLEHLKEPHIRLDFKDVVWQHLEEKEHKFESNFLIPVPVVGNINFDFLIEETILLNTLHSATIGYSKVIINQIHTDFFTIKKYVPKYNRILIFNDESPVAESSRFGLLDDVLDFHPIAWSKREDEIKEAIKELA